MLKQSLVLILTLIATTTSAQVAQPSVTPMPTPFVDPNPYQSQTWYRLNSGLIKTLSARPGPEAFQFEHPNSLPEIYAAGSNFGIFKGRAGFLIGVVDAQGRFYQYDEAIEPSVVGGVYYVRKSNQAVVVIDSDGAVMETSVTAPSIKLAGGNYFIDPSGTITTIKSMGMAKWNWAGMIIEKTGLKLPTPLFAGGNFFIDVEGKVTTIASTTGFISDPIALPDNDSVRIYGGNYLITDQLKLYSISNEGALQFVRKIKELPTVRGYSYIGFKDHTFLILKGDGSAFDRITNTAMSGKPTVQYMIDFNQIHSTSVSKIGGVK